MSVRLARFTLLAICILALAAGPAMAQSTPTEDAYGGQAGVQQGGGGGTPTVSGGSGSLPFTGLQLGFAALVGAGLAGTGFALRRGLQTPAQP
jgi:hypothetical protein